MTRWLQAAKAASPPADKTDTTDTTQPQGERTRLAPQPDMVMSVVSVLSGRGIPGQSPGAPEVPRPGDDPFRHGRGVTGDPRTWTGRIFSLDDWRRLSDWERHGPDGRLWCGCCRGWVDRATALGHARAIRAEWLAREGRTEDG